MVINFKNSPMDIFVCGMWIKVRAASGDTWTAFIVSDREESIGNAKWESNGHLWRHLAFTAAMDALEHGEISTD